MKQAELKVTGIMILLVFVCCQLKAQSNSDEFVIIYDGTTQPVSRSTTSPRLEPTHSTKPNSHSKLVLKRKLLPYTFPIKGQYRFTSAYGYRKHPIYKDLRFHRGVDLACRVNTPVYAPLDGEVIRSGWSRGYGYCIKLKHANGIQTLFGHLNKCIVRKGQIVEQDQIIGRTGNTGISTGPHLHFELWIEGKQVNPVKHLKFNK